ncbi:DegV family protein [Orenia marismortui]|uniref:DegV family protein n=1 Tax=Orenia marismortui TaxID=46469 RepID=UPI0003787F8D|nr:DegV family protein [Orenia marismortui]
MNIKIVADSGCDLNPELQKKLNIKLVPLTINIGENEYQDNESFNVKQLLNIMKENDNPPKTASPSPNLFMEAYEGDENVFVITLSSKLSSTYNNAILAKNMFLEDKKEKFIHVFDSLSASIGETLVSLKIQELAQNNTRSKIIEKTNKYIKEMKTFFLLESLDNLIKAGRMNKVKGKLASFLSIKPIMGDENGEIKLVDKARGSKRAFKKLVNVIGKHNDKLEEKILGIAHCNCLEKAERFKEEVLKKYNFKDIIIVETGGLSSVYANDGGIIISF